MLSRYSGLARAVAVCAVAGGCAAGMAHPFGGGATSRAFEPPASWRAGVRFTFADSNRYAGLPYGARIEFLDGRRTVRASGRDLFEHENSEVRTPWYRIWVPASGEAVTTIRVTIGDRAGQETVAEYPLPMRDTTFYYVRFGIGTERPANGPSSGIDLVGTRTYPVPPGARREPTDSLIISYASHTRGCFRCIY